MSGSRKNREKSLVNEEVDLLTQEYLKQRLEYCPDTGIFKWRDSGITYKANIGKVAGSISIQGYVLINLDNFSYCAHRLAFLYMTGEMPSSPVDHINHVRSDNRFCNLRIAPDNTNHKNASKDKRNKTGVTGVQFRSDANIYVARINVDKKDVYLGCFKSMSEAVNARKLAEQQYGFHENHGKRCPIAYRNR